MLCYEFNGILHILDSLCRKSVVGMNELSENFLGTTPGNSFFHTSGLGQSASPEMARQPPGDAAAKAGPSLKRIEMAKVAASTNIMEQ